MQRASGAAVNFAPTNAYSTLLLPDKWIDIAGGAHLIRQPGRVRRVRVTEFGTEFALWGAEIVSGVRQGAFVCPTVGAVSSPGTQAALYVTKTTSAGIGGYYIGCLRGPNKNQPLAHGGTPGMTWGTDRGWGVSSNDGGKEGFGAYGTENLADQDARVFRPNTDEATNTTSRVGRGFRVGLFGYDPDYGGAGVGAGYLWSADANQRIWEYVNPIGTPDNQTDDPEGSDPTGGVGSAGDMSSPDGRFAIGAVEYGTNGTTNADSFITYLDGVVACVYYFTGAAATNVHANRTAIVTAIQASLDAAVQA